MDRNKILSDRVIELKSEIVKLKEECALRKGGFEDLLTRYENSNKSWIETCQGWETLYNQKVNELNALHEKVLWVTGGLVVGFVLYFVLYFLKG